MTNVDVEIKNIVFLKKHNEETTGVEIPKEFKLAQNYPNPFNPSTIIRFGLPVAEKVTIKVYDVLGREVKTLINEELRPGYQQVEWDGTNNYGSRVSSGIYIYRMVAGKFVKTMKMMMLK